MTARKPARPRPTVADDAPVDVLLEPGAPNHGDDAPEEPAVEVDAAEPVVDLTAPSPEPTTAPSNAPSPGAGRPAAAVVPPPPAGRANRALVGAAVAVGLLAAVVAVVLRRRRGV